MVRGSRSTTRLRDTPQFDCDVGLGLRMQQQEITSDEYSSYPSKRAMTSPHPNHHLGGGSAFSDGGGVGGGIGEGGTPFFSSTNNQLFAAFTPTAGEAEVRGPFTTSQRHELERQNMIFKYLTAYNYVPADLILPLSRNPTSQTKSSGLDSEPWRCRRTDGKKWRCTKDVAPDQKFCEKHAHKSRARSRKHVEIQSKNITYSQHKETPILETPFPIFSKIGSTTCDQTSIGWLKSGTQASTISQVSACTQEQIESSTRMESSNFRKNAIVFQHQENDQDENPDMGNDYYPYFDPKVMTSPSQSSPTRRFIDAWSSDETGNKKGPFSLGRSEFPLSSLTLSVSSGEGGVDETGHEAMKPQWMMSNVSWLNSTGGPLGEALCPGNSCSNTTSSCSKGSCDEGNHQFDFFG